MAKLGIDWGAFKIRELLNHRDREGAERMILDLLGSGTAGPEAQKLAAYFFGGGKGGRPPAGRYKIAEIGWRALELESEGLGREAVIDKIMEEFSERRDNVSRAHVDKCIREFNQLRGAE